MEITDRVDLFFFFAQPIHPHLPNIVYFCSRVHVHNKKKKKKNSLPQTRSTCIPLEFKLLN